ncbi:Aste57867_23370 [Aphanomyces stellatus]|uniref:Aste57867_23370 protein n=1 Tax=Aphanomyces stellatus TaxID=120398 RepID=A0A485LML0_9STRA|nr:hypothetical protein As57867_023299 [Aphanomyces stellatus]VFU00016.1 Aste57867_23370 [Aphanomyces stellatus]
MIRPGNDDAGTHVPSPPLSSTTEQVPASAPTSTSTQMQRGRKLAILVVIIVGVVLILKYAHIGKALESVSKWIEDHKAAGVVVMLAMFVVAVVFGIPITVFEALSGFFIGWGWSLLLSTAGKCGGSMVTFFVGRFFSGDMINVWMQKYPVMRALGLVFASKSSWQLLFCVQLSYIPLTLKCYMLSILKVSAFRFFVTNLVSGIPYSVFWGYVGSQCKDVSKIFEGESKTGNTKLYITGGGIAFGLLALATVGYYTKTKLAELQIDSESGGSVKPIGAKVSMEANEVKPKSVVSLGSLETKT